MHVWLCLFQLQKTHKIDIYSWKRARLFCREVFNAHQTDQGSRPHSSQLFPFFSFLFFFSFTGLNLKDITAKSIRSDQCLIPKQLLLLVCYLPLFPSLCVHVWKFQANNSLPSWGSLWHSSSWKSSAVKPPDLYSFLTCTSGFQHMLDLRSPTHGSRGRVIYYTPHFLSWSGEIRSKIEMG